jgi:hypothetical protein
MLASLLAQKSFYFSYTYDVTSTAQQQAMMVRWFVQRSTATWARRFGLGQVSHPNFAAHHAGWQLQGGVPRAH